MLVKPRRSWRESWGEDKALTLISLSNHYSPLLSLVSLADPWLDLFSPLEAIKAAKEVNDDLEQFCSPSKAEGQAGSPGSAFSAGDARSNFTCSVPTSSRIRAFGSLPFAPEVPVSELVSSLEGIAKSSRLSGAILGSRGLGKGLDDPELEPLWEAAERLGQVLFLHPHFGVGAEASEAAGLWGAQDNGHVLPLALGFR